MRGECKRLPVALYQEDAVLPHLPLSFCAGGDF